MRPKSLIEIPTKNKANSLSGFWMHSFTGLTCPRRRTPTCSWVLVRQHATTRRTLSKVEFWKGRYSPWKTIHNIEIYPRSMFFLIVLCIGRFMFFLNNQGLLMSCSDMNAIITCLLKQPFWIIWRSSSWIAFLGVKLNDCLVGIAGTAWRRVYHLGNKFDWLKKCGAKRSKKDSYLSRIFPRKHD